MHYILIIQINPIQYQILHVLFMWTLNVESDSHVCLHVHYSVLGKVTFKCNVLQYRATP